MKSRDDRRFPLMLLAAASLIARAEDVQRMAVVESTAREDELIAAGARIVPARVPALPSPTPARCWRTPRGRASCAMGI
jgi:hypothetical protein